MKRANVHVKVEVELEANDDPAKFADELCRQILKTYGVRSAEVTSIMPEEGR